MLAGFSLKLLNHQFSVIVDIQDDSPVIIRSGFGGLTELGNGLATPIKRFGSNNPVKNALTAYQDRDFELVQHLKSQQQGSDFATKVWRGISQIKPGKTISYAQLANRIGRPNAYRAVGTACGRNNLPIFVPCHRVLPSSGEVGNYAYGSAVKELLLRHESDKPHIRR
jgi:O-6-methylguanine DNA methyltransferase